ncbi:MAG: hypothetical protein U0237_12890 [Thermoleophilia bacterium]
MTTPIDDLVRDFRATERGPLPGAEHEILRRAVAATPRHAPSHRRWHTLMPAVGLAAAAAGAAVLLWPGGSGPGSVLDHAAAAVAPADALVELRATITDERPDGTGWRAWGERTLVNRTLFDGGRTLRSRYTVTGTAAEDSAVTALPDGRVRVETAEPGGGVSSKTVRTDALGRDFSIPGVLRHDYESGLLEVARRGDGRLVLRSTAPPCASRSFFSEVTVDAGTFRPLTAVSYDLCSSPPGGAPAAGSRLRWRFDAVRAIPETPENLRLLGVGA